MKPKAIFIVRHTHNYETMLQFYRDMLEMKLVGSWDESGNRGTLLSPEGDTNNVRVEILELGEEAVNGGKPINVMLSIEIKEVDGWHEQLLGKGVTIARGLEDASWGHRSFGVDDPDGFRIWFYEDISLADTEKH